MEMKRTLEHAKEAGEKGLEQGIEQGMRLMRPMKMLHGWGVRSEHAYSAGIAALGVAVLCRLFTRKSHEEGRGFAHHLGQLAPVLLLIGLGLKHEE